MNRNFLNNIIYAIKGKGCQRLHSQNKNEITISGIGFDIGVYRINTDEISTRVKEFYQITPTMVALDNSQYLLCDLIRQLNEGEFKDLCLKARFLVISFYNRLVSILSLPSSYNIENDLREWNRQANRFQDRLVNRVMEDMAHIDPDELTQIMEYQGISEEDMNQALKLIR